MNEVKHVIISDDDDNIRLDRWFKRHYPELKHGHLEKLLRSKQIKVDNKKATSNQRILAGQSLRIPPLNIETQPKDAATDAKASVKDQEFLKSLVIYEDKNLCAINKPFGLAVQGGTNIQNSVDSLFRKAFPDADYKLVHRLDKNTSGVLVLAKNAKTAAELTKRFKERNVTKTYWALTKNVPNPAEGTIRLRIRKGVDAHDKEKMVADPKNGDRAETDYRVIESLGKKLAWVELVPLSGRKHQLRVHANAIECPIVGDGKYGGALSMVEGIDKKMHLHARAIKLDQLFGKNILVEAELPEHMKKSWKFLGFEQ
ncbi:MAG: RluA family pseudouridine synthase [Rickettsiales bacterium]|nr:RluA family pseudouridine synthase [Rickettsiales bacterium]